MINNHLKLLGDSKIMIDKINLDKNKLIDNILEETFKEPPCNTCHFYHPRYLDNEIVLCNNRRLALGGFHNFNCYEAKETQKIIPVNTLPQIEEAKQNVIYKCEDGLFMFHDGKYKPVNIEYA